MCEELIHARTCLRRLGEAAASQTQTAVFPTEVLDGVVALLVVHFDGLRMRAADAITDGVATHHDVLVLWRRPAHHDAVDQRAHVQRAGLVGHAGFWGGNSSQTQSGHK